VEIVTAADRRDLEDEAEAAIRGKWPEFILHDPVSRRLFERVERYFAEYDILVLDEGRVVAGDGVWRFVGMHISPGNLRRAGM